MAALANNPVRPDQVTKEPTIAALPQEARQQQLLNTTTPLPPKVYDDLARAVGNLGPNLQQSFTQDGKTGTITRDYSKSSDEPTFTIEIGDRKAVITPTPNGPTVSGMTTGEVAKLARTISDASNPFGMNP